MQPIYHTRESFTNRHNYGRAMGSPVSVCIANLVMSRLHIEERAISSFDTPPKFWKRFVDDICTVLKIDIIIITVHRSPEIN